jgi:plasmid replication initiation protein
MKNKDNLMVYKANQVVEASYKLTLNEQRVVLACIAQVHSREALLTTDEFELSAKDFAKFFSVSEDRAYHSLIEVAESLFNRYVVIDNPYLDRPKIKRIKMRWISSIEYLTDELKGQFTRYELKHVGNMTSIYGIRLYELLMQWRTTQIRVIEVDSLKKQFEIENKYSAIKDFKKYVIDPAIKDINEHSNYDVTWNQKKTGRSVTHLIFEFKEKESAPSLVKVKKQKTKNKDDNDDKNGVIIDNIEYFADMRKKYGDAVTKAIPADMIELLKSQGRW